MSKGRKISINDAIESVTYFGSRTPQTTDEEMKDAFCILSDYRDGGVFAGHYAGFSEWERHPVGDEIVTVLDGETTLILLENNEERRNSMVKGDLIVVPKNVWHRFETPKGVKIMTVTPQPTDHRIERPRG